MDRPRGRVVELTEDEYVELRRYARHGAERQSLMNRLKAYALYGVIAAFLFFLIAVSTPHNVSIAETFGLPHLTLPHLGAPAQPAAPAPTAAIVAPTPYAGLPQPAVVAPAGPNIDTSNRTRIGLDDSGRPYAEREERRIEPATPVPSPEPPRQVVVDAGIRSSGPYVNVESRPAAAPQEQPAALPPVPAANAPAAEVAAFKQSFTEQDQSQKCLFIGCLNATGPTATLPPAPVAGASPDEVQSFKDSFK